MKSLATRRAQ